MASTIPLPDGLTSASLREAKGSEISFWIEKTNAAAGKRVLTKNGRVDDKRKRLAEYYDINLSAGTAVVAASVRPKTDEEHIKECQFSWLRELGEEWSRTTSAGREFALCDGSSEEPCSASLLREAVSQLSKLTVCAASSAVATPLDFQPIVSF